MAAGSPAEWDAVAALETCPINAWSGDVWRCHSRRYGGDDAAGSLKSTGRFNRGTDKFEVSEIWPALYTSMAPHVALGERLRHTTPRSLSQLGNQRLSRLRVRLHAVLDLCAATGCADLAVVGLDMDSLCRPADYEKSHRLAQIARDRAEALLVPSCTRFAEGNLIVFPDRLLAESSIVVEETVDPDLFVDWENV